MKTVTVVGAGFSGLTVAYYLQKQGFQVHLYEKGDRIGGLLGTERETAGLIEMAANALLSSATVEELFDDLTVPMAKRLPSRKKRYIYWNKPTRWPLDLRSSVRLFQGLLRWKFKPLAIAPRSQEPLEDWGQRFGGRQFQERLLSPALLGIYAGDSRRLSASLIFNQLMNESAPRGKLKGSVAPEQGMEQLLQALKARVRQQGGEFHLQTSYQMTETPKHPTVVATSAWAAADVLRLHDPRATSVLESCESLPLVSVTAFFPRQKEDLIGFGCLFPESQNFKSLGVLFNSCIFDNRSDLRSETWILGGTRDLDITSYGDEHLLEAVLLDRKKLMGHRVSPLRVRFTRWHRAIPYYTTDWERRLSELKVAPPIYLHGNYIGSIGLSRILERSKRLAAEIKAKYG